MLSLFEKMFGRAFWNNAVLEVGFLYLLITERFEIVV